MLLHLNPGCVLESGGIKKPQHWPQLWWITSGAGGRGMPLIFMMKLELVLDVERVPCRGHSGQEVPKCDYPLESPEGTLTSLSVHESLHVSYSESQGGEIQLSGLKDLRTMVYKQDMIVHLQGETLKWN